MKKILISLLIIATVSLLYINRSKLLDSLVKAQSDEIVNQAQKIVSDKAQEDKLKQIEETRMRNITTKKIINSELHKTQKIIVLQGSATYQNVVPKQAFVKWFNNNLNIELKYNYSITYDASNIEVIHIDQGIAYVRLNLDRENFQQIVALQNDSIKQVKDKEQFAVGFTNEDLQNILKIAQDDVENEIANDDEVYKQSIEGLKEFISEIGEKFGLLEIKFIE
jgi:hypothetical protein